MFIGREKELAKLNQLYQTETFQFPVIYGRRRVGKTALINEFVKNKEVIFFTGIESNAQQNLENLSKSIFLYTTGIDNSPVFPSFQSALEYVFKLAEQKRIVLVIDEYPYAAKSYGALSSVLQVLIDKNKDTSKLFLILCGSSMSFMEEQVLGYQSPLYGRRTSQFKIQPFDFVESCRYFKNFSSLDMAEIGMYLYEYYLAKMFGSGDSYSLQDTISRIKMSDYPKNTKLKMIEFVKEITQTRSAEIIINTMKKNQAIKLIEQFNEIDTNYVTAVKSDADNFKDCCIPAPLVLCREHFC